MEWGTKQEEQLRITVYHPLNNLMGFILKSIIDFLFWQLQGCEENGKMSCT